MWLERIFHGIEEKTMWNWFSQKRHEKRDILPARKFLLFPKKRNQNSTSFCDFRKKAFSMEGRKYAYTNIQKFVGLTQTCPN